MDEASIPQQDHPPPTRACRTMREVGEYRERVEAARRKAHDASLAISLLADTSTATPQRASVAARRLDEAAAELRSLGVTT